MNWLNLSWQIYTSEARKLMSYRADFWAKSLVTFLTAMTIAYCLWHSIYESTGKTEIQGYRFEVMILYYFVILNVRKLVEGEELGGGMSQEIYDGSLSRYLIYPLNYLRFKYIQHLGAQFPIYLQVAFFTLLFPLLFTFQLEIPLSLTHLLLALLIIYLAHFTQFLMLYCIEGIAFWADNIWSLIVMLRFTGRLLGGVMLPLEIFPDWATPLLNLLPFKSFFYLPTKIMMGEATLAQITSGLMTLLIWMVILAIVGKFTWRRGLLTYSGVGI